MRVFSLPSKRESSFTPRQTALSSESHRRRRSGPCRAVTWTCTFWRQRLCSCPRGYFIRLTLSSCGAAWRSSPRRCSVLRKLKKGEKSLPKHLTFSNSPTERNTFCINTCCLSSFRSEGNILSLHLLIKLGWFPLQERGTL